MAVLQDLPPTLDETYIRALRQVKIQYPYGLQTTKWILALLVNCLEPLHIAALAEALAYDCIDGTYDYSGVPADPSDLLRYSAGMFRVDAEGMVGLTHFSVKEFLLSRRFEQSDVNEFWTAEPSVHIDIFKACLLYLMKDEFGQPVPQSRNLWQSRFKAFPFLAYAAVNLMRHLELCEQELGDELNHELISFFTHSSQSQNLLSWQYICHSYRQ